MTPHDDAEPCDRAGASPFRRASENARRVQILHFGDAGAGRTTVAFPPPSPVVLDLEDGTALYGAQADIDVEPPASADDSCERHEEES